MNTVSFMPLCHLCNNPINLEFARTDEDGHTVHEGCYLLKLKVKSNTPWPPQSQGKP
jgi:hypothetical protein